MNENVTVRTPAQVVEITDDIRNAQKEKYPNHDLFEIILPDCEQHFIVRDGNWTESAKIMGANASSPGKTVEQMPIDVIGTYVIFPDVDLMDVENNLSGFWKPGRVSMLSGKIQEALGFREGGEIKKL